MKFILLAILLVGCNIMAATAQSDKIVDNRAIDTLDLKKYVGLWYEIARFDHPFERGLVGVTTEYTIKPDGSIEVIGRGYQDSLRGEKKEIVGHVHIPDTTRIITFWKSRKITARLSSEVPNAIISGS